MDEQGRVGQRAALSQPDIRGVTSNKPGAAYAKAWAGLGVSGATIRNVFKSAADDGDQESTGGAPKRSMGRGG
jgi:hypothetical protein